MKRILIALLSLLAAAGLSSCGSGNVREAAEQPAEQAAEQTTEPVAEAAPICLVTYNVGGFFKSESNSTAMIAAMMKELGADVISMNELDSCTTRHPEFQIRDFTEAMGGWNYTFAPAMDYKGGAYGIGIASSPELIIQAQHRLTLPKGDGSEQRALAVCEFEDFVFCSTHLDHKSSAAQLAQAQKISTWIEATYGTSSKPVILCGDFNALPESETILFMKKGWKVVSPESPTFSSSKPSKCIDYIMIYKNAATKVSVLSAKVKYSFSSGDVKTASDHLPVMVKIKITD